MFIFGSTFPCDKKKKRLENKVDGTLYKPFSQKSALVMPHKAGALSLPHAATLYYSSSCYSDPQP